MYGSRKHRSQAIAQAIVGMTCFLKPARTTEKEKPTFHVIPPASYVIPAGAGGEEGIYRRRLKRQEP
jgi:hypothetical protein